MVEATTVRLFPGPRMLLELLAEHGPLNTAALTDLATARGFTQGRKGIVKRRSELKLRGLVGLVNLSSDTDEVTWGVTPEGRAVLAATDSGDGTTAEQQPEEETMVNGAMVESAALVDPGCEASEDRARLSYRGVRGNGDDRYAKNANGSVSVEPAVHDAYKVFRKRMGWQHNADEHEVRGFIGGYKAGQEAASGDHEEFARQRLASAFQVLGLPYDPGQSPGQNLAAALNAAQTEALTAAIEADPLAVALTVNEVLDRKACEAQAALEEARLAHEDAEAALTIAQADLALARETGEQDRRDAASFRQMRSMFIQDK